MSGWMKNRNRVLLATAAASTVFGAAPVAAQSATPQPPSVSARPVRLMSTVQPSWGRIRTFGELEPQWRRIRSFGGEAAPSLAELTAFWGRIRTFTNSDGTTFTPNHSAIFAFQNDITAQWRRIRSFWNAAAVSNAPSDYEALTQDLNGLIARSEAEYGAAVQTRTGQSFAAAFAQPMLNRFGINLSDPTSLAGLDQDEREEFFVTWFDNLMQYSGADQIDHWMGSVNWTPALTQALGDGRDARIGILDFTLTGSEARNVVTSGGVSTYTNGHGSAVAGLMVAPHDGRGVMGIAPNASVISYNPFDASGTASWADVSNGVLMLARNGATIINMSLGVPGYTLHQGWNDVFSNRNLYKETEDSIFVIAAGNDGITQAQNITWNHSRNPAIIVVGSVGLDNRISDFSNRPGNACLLDGSRCRSGDRLMDRFIVAPGEFILVSDGNGGVMRASGTSFAAPIVSGAIALIHDRWPWLADRPNDTVNLILGSARDLGAPGTDPVYGRGLLDIQAALSPENFSSLRWYQSVNGQASSTSADRIRNTSAAVRASWEASSVYFYVFEDTGESQRDFAIPLSTRLLGQSVGSSQEQFNTYLQSRFLDWLNAPTQSGGRDDDDDDDDDDDGDDGDDDDDGDFTDVGRFRAALAGLGNLNATMAMTPRVRRRGFHDSGVPFDTSLSVAAGRRFAFHFGTGESSVALGGQSGFAMQSDHDPNVGGGNPFLGLASGGGYIRFDVALGDRWTLSSGFATRSSERDLDSMPMQERSYFSSFGPYRAGAGNLSITYEPSSAFSVTASYTRLQEQDAVLGMQSVDLNDFRDGSSTDAATLSAELQIASGLSLAASATAARTTTSDDPEQNIRLANGGMMSTAFQVGVTQNGILGSRDRLRVSVAQPMHAESSRIDFTQVRVINRNTGEIGEVTDTIVVPGQERRYMAEMIYAAPLLNGAGEVSLFGRAQLAGEAPSEVAGLLAGARFRVGF